MLESYNMTHIYYSVKSKVDGLWSMWVSVGGSTERSKLLKVDGHKLTFRFKMKFIYQIGRFKRPEVDDQRKWMVLKFKSERSQEQNPEDLRKVTVNSFSPGPSTLAPKIVHFGGSARIG